MSRNKHSVDAFSLPAVIVISALVMMLILFAFSLKSLDYKNHDTYREMKQSRMDLHSAAALYMCDSTLLDSSDSVCISVYSEGEAPITIGKQRWGFYETVSIRHSKEDPFRKRYMMGQSTECSHRAALWLCDRNRALSLAGNSSIMGQVYVPLNGINYPELEGRKFQGVPVPSDMLLVSRRFLPELSEASLMSLDSLRGMRNLSIDYRNIPGTGKYRSFEEPTIYAHCHIPGEVELHLNGNIVLYGEKLVISGKSDMHDIIVFARSVTIEDGFRGSAQIFCEDSIRIGTGVRLEFPSGAFVDASGPDKPCITVDNGSQVNGYIGIINGDGFDYVLENPCFKLRKSSLVRGLLYADGSCDIAGSIKGAAYIKDCFYRDRYSIYAGTLYDVTVEREDSLAFPLMLDGPYRRKIIKNLY